MFERNRPHVRIPTFSTALNINHISRRKQQDTFHIDWSWTFAPIPNVMKCLLEINFKVLHSVCCTQCAAHSVLNTVCCTECAEYSVLHTFFRYDWIHTVQYWPTSCLPGLPGTEKLDNMRATCNLYGTNPWVTSWDVCSSCVLVHMWKDGNWYTWGVHFVQLCIEQRVAGGWCASRGQWITLPGTPPCPKAGKLAISHHRHQPFPIIAIWCNHHWHSTSVKALDWMMVGSAGSPNGFASNEKMTRRGGR